MEPNILGEFLRWVSILLSPKSTMEEKFSETQLHVVLLPRVLGEIREVIGGS